MPSRRTTAQLPALAARLDPKVGEPAVVFEDNHLLAINKPFGMPAQGGEQTNVHAVEWVTEYLRVTYNKPGNIFAAPLHRLDQPVGGLMLFAKTSKAATRMTQQFQEKGVMKTYAAITDERPEPLEDVLVHYLSKVPGEQRMRATTRARDKEAKEAVLYYRVLRTLQKRALVEVVPLTGRKHQIRAQLAKIGCPLAGDRRYGASSTLRNRSIALFARELFFQHPVRRRAVRLSLALPMFEPWREFERG